MRIGHSDVYQIYKDLIIHSENISWSRFQCLLIINSVLVVAWATLFINTEHSAWAKIVMAAIALLGIVSGFAWCDLGRRGRRYLKDYQSKAKAIEKKDDWWKAGIPFEDRPFQVEEITNLFSSSTILLTWTPLCFSAINVLLLLATING